MFQTLCEVCRKPTSNKCARCNIVFYCTQDHQKSHWSEHKKFCLHKPKTTQPVVSLAQAAAAIPLNPLLAAAAVPLPFLPSPQPVFTQYGKQDVAGAFEWLESPEGMAILQKLAGRPDPFSLQRPTDYLIDCLSYLSPFLIYVGLPMVLSAMTLLDKTVPIIEVGSGNGSFAALLTLLGFTAYCIDPDPTGWFHATFYGQREKKVLKCDYPLLKHYPRPFPARANLLLVAPYPDYEAFGSQPASTNTSDIEAVRAHSWEHIVTVCDYSGRNTAGGNQYIAWIKEQLERKTDYGPELIATRKLFLGWISLIVLKRGYKGAFYEESQDNSGRAGGLLREQISKGLTVEQRIMKDPSYESEYVKLLKKRKPLQP